MYDWIKGRVAIVTGGASGIGQAIVKEAASQGAITVIFDRNVEMGRKTEAFVREEGHHCHFFEVDVTSAEAITRAVEASAELGPIGYLANSAGLQTYGTIDSTSIDTWDLTMDVNLKSMFLVSKQVLPEIRKSGSGGIVHISSIQGLRCQKNVLAYATAKGAVIAMTRSMGLDHAAEGILVNCICPGSVDTPLLRYGAAQHGPVDQVLKQWASGHPIGRIGTAEEIAKVTLFLWSPESSFIVGQAIVADGGLGSIIL